MSMHRLSVMSCPHPACHAGWGFTPTDPAEYWLGKASIRGRLILHLLADHWSDAESLMGLLVIQEERWWSD